MRKIVRACMLGVGLLSFSVAAFSQQVAKRISYAASPDGGIGFLEFRPSDYGSQRHPLIIFLHGIGERGNGTTQIGSVTSNAIPRYCANGASMRFTYNGQTSSFVVLSPQLSTSYGYWPTYYVKEMINYAKANLQIDPNRIYITGLSLGGGGVWRVITDTQGFDHTFDAGIAAVAPVCGTQEENDYDFCSTIGLNHLPIWAFHSMDDGTVGVGTTQHAEILSNQCGVTPAPKFTYYQYGGHVGAWINAYDTGHITTQVNGGGSFTAYPNMYEWFLSQSRSGNTTPNYTSPVANAGVPQVIAIPVNTVTLTGTGTGTNGATISSYSWTKTNGPSSGSISSPNAASTAVTGLVQGTYIFTLTVTDNHGLTSSSSVTITVNTGANQYPVSNAGQDVALTLPANSYTLDATSSYDPDGAIVKYHWLKLSSGPGTVADENSARTTVTGLGQGYYEFSLQVTDNYGASSYDNINITVNAAAVSGLPTNQFPVPNAGQDATITLPSNSYALDATSSYDPDGTIVKYHWLKLSSGPGTVADENSARTTVTGLGQGYYEFSLQVTDNNGASSYDNINITVNAAPPSGSEQPAGYIKQSVGLWQACDDASSGGRIPVYCSSIANGSLVYLDAAHNNLFNGGWNWFSYTPVSGGSVTQAFSVFPDGTIHLLANCSSTAPPITPPVTSNLLGYIKMSVGPYQACDDASSSGRIPLYGTNIANGSYVYKDAALTQKYDGDWNWFSFTPVLGGSVTYAFVIYPIGSIGLLRTCSGGSRLAAPIQESASMQQSASMQRSETSVQDAEVPAVAGKLTLYPNPVHTSATIELNSASNGVKTVNLYNSGGVLKAKYSWQAIKGKNVFSLKNIAGLPGGLYIIDIRDSDGKANGKLKFVKL